MGKRAPRYAIAQSFVKRLGKPFLLLSIMFYLGFHALTGEHGLFAWFSESHKLEVLKAELADVTAKREALDHKNKLFSNNSLDLDLLDEQSRRVLGMAGPGEEVIFLNKDGQADNKQ